MENLQERIEKLKKHKTTSFYLSLFLTLFILYRIITLYPSARAFSGKLIVVYLGLNLVVCLICIFLLIRNIPELKYKDQPEKYLKAQVHRTILSIQTGVLFFYMPLHMGIMAIPALQLSWNQKPNY